MFLKILHRIKTKILMKFLRAVDPLQEKELILDAKQSSDPPIGSYHLQSWANQM